MKIFSGNFHKQLAIHKNIVNNRFHFCSPIGDLNPTLTSSNKEMPSLREGTNFTKQGSTRPARVRQPICGGEIATLPSRPSKVPASSALSNMKNENKKMKVLGLIGGMSWESTVVYYQLINRRVREKMGGLHSSKCIIHSFDFAEIEHLQSRGNWEEAGVLMGEAGASLQRGGADAVVICTNTMHKLSSFVEQRSGLPLLHIADATAESIKKSGYQRVGLLGTRYTMEQDFYKSRLVDSHGLDVLIPEELDRVTVNSIIYDELCNGIIKDTSRAAYIEIVQRLQNNGAQCVILGCTEIGLLLKSDDVELPVFDTTEIHAQAAADWAMKIA